MNGHQKVARERIARRFSRGDGVEIIGAAAPSASPPPPEAGTVVGFASDEAGLQGYLVRLGDCIELVACGALSSRPDMNAGKYGGQSRGGAAGGWMGVSRYRGTRTSRRRC